MPFRLRRHLLVLALWLLALFSARLSAQTFTFSTLAGGSTGTNDGANGSAQFYFPSGIAVDHEGNLFVSDTSNNTIRKITPVGTNWVVTTIAGFPAFGGAGSTNDGTGGDARFWRPNGLAIDRSGN